MKMRFLAIATAMMMLFAATVHGYSTDSYAPDPKRDTASELVLYKDSAMTEKYASPDDIPEGETVYYEIVSEPGYICYELEIDVYEVTDTYFINEYAGAQLDYTLKSTLAGDIDLSTTYTLKDASAIMRYVAGYTVEYWELGQSGYGECIMDFDCDGKVNLLDVTGVMKEAAGYDIDRTAPCPGTYGIRHRLPVYSVTVPSAGVKYLCDNGYVVWESESCLYELDLPDSVAAKFDEEFFEKFDLAVFCGMCAGGEKPVIKELWYDTDTHYLTADFECSNISFGEGYAVLVPVGKNLEVCENYPR